MVVTRVVLLKNKFCVLCSKLTWKVDDLVDLPGTRAVEEVVISGGEVQHTVEQIVCYWI